MWWPCAPVSPTRNVKANDFKAFSRSIKSCLCMYAGLSYFHEPFQRSSRTKSWSVVGMKPAHCSSSVFSWHRLSLKTCGMWLLHNWKTLVPLFFLNSSYPPTLKALPQVFQLKKHVNSNIHNLINQVHCQISSTTAVLPLWRFIIATAINLGCGGGLKSFLAMLPERSASLPW